MTSRVEATVDLLHDYYMIYETGGLLVPVIEDENLDDADIENVRVSGLHMGSELTVSICDHLLALTCAEREEVLSYYDEFAHQGEG